jgi:hypothetical protein
VAGPRDVSCVLRNPNPHVEVCGGQSGNVLGYPAARGGALRRGRPPTWWLRSIHAANTPGETPAIPDAGTDPGATQPAARR